MALNNDIVQIKAAIGELAIGLGSLCEAIAELSDKIDGIESSGNEPCPTKEDIFQELKVIFGFVAKRYKADAIVVIRRLTGCGVKEAKELVEIIDVTNHD